MEKCQRRNRKNKKKRIIKKYPNRQHHRTKRANLFRKKQPSYIPRKNLNRNTETGWKMGLAIVTTSETTEERKINNDTME